MIIYNVTTKVHHSIHDAWLQWLKEDHIPAILKTACFTTATILRLLEVDETDGPTYAVQYHAESKALYNHYIEAYSTNMSQQSFDKWGDQFISFRSVMVVVN
jgi:hypothetical protein